MIPERRLEPEAAEAWIRECLSLHPEGAELTVSGACMEPAIADGARIRLRVPEGPPRVGEVVLIRIPGGLRLHRVLLRVGGWIRTKGDRGRYLDPRVRASEVIAACPLPETRLQGFGRAVSSLARLLLRPWPGAGVEALRLW